MNGGNLTSGVGNAIGSNGGSSNINTTHANDHIDNNSGTTGPNVSKNIKARVLGSNTSNAGNTTNATSNGQTISNVAKTGSSTDATTEKNQSRMSAVSADVGGGKLTD